MAVEGLGQKKCGCGRDRWEEKEKETGEGFLNRRGDNIVEEERSYYESFEKKKRG